MEQKHRDAIQNNFTSLVERTDLDSVVTALYEKGVFSEQMIEPYQNKNEGERDRKRKLYRNITHRGPDAFGRLVEVLGELGYWDLVRDLDPNSPYSYFNPRTFNPTPNPKPRAADDDNFRSLSSEKNKPKTAPKNVPLNSVPPQQPSQLNSVPPQLPLDNDNAAAEIPAPHFTVQKSTKFMEDDNTRDLKLYRTRGRNRGVLLDFTYMTFDNNIEEVRNGVDVDCNNLMYLFTELGFRVLRYRNLTMDETVETLQSLKNVLVDVESVFIVVSSHGYERAHTSDTELRCTDGKLMRLLDLMSYFNNTNMPGLIGVPKVFIFQMCRGSNQDFTWRNLMSRAPPQMAMPQGDVRYDGQPVAPHSSASPGSHSDCPPTPTPLYSDILIAHSTLPGLVARRDGKRGSWYIQVLCEVFAERAHNCHVEKMFTLVDQRMREKFRVQTSSVDRWGFNKRLYLHPGLYEP